MLLISLFADVFRGDELGGWGHGVVVAVPHRHAAPGRRGHLIAHGNGMTPRSLKQAQQAQAAQVDYVKSVARAASSSPADVSGVLGTIRDEHTSGRSVDQRKAGMPSIVPCTVPI